MDQTEAPRRRAVRRSPSPPPPARTPDPAPLPIAPILAPQGARDASRGDLASPGASQSPAEEFLELDLTDVAAVSPPPSPPPAAPRITLEPGATPEAVHRLLNDVRQKRVDPRTLSVSARRALVALLAEGQTAAKDGKPGRRVSRQMLSELLRVGPKTISADLVSIRRGMGKRLMERWGVEGAVGFLEQTAEECYLEARERGDPGLAWAIRSNFVRQLKELGALGGKEEQEGFKVTFETVGGSLARLTRQLEEAFDPRLSGERIVEGRGRVLPLPETLPGPELSPAEDLPVAPPAASDLPAIFASGEPPDEDVLRVRPSGGA